MIELKFVGTSAECRAEMMALLGFTTAVASPQATEALLGVGPIGTGGMTATEAAAAQGVELMKSEKPARGRGRSRSTPQTIEGEVTSKTEAPAQNISTNPENRVDPETAAQDKADEAASEEKPGAKVYTIDDVRNSAGAYVKKWGMDAASVDLVPCMMKAVGVGKMSELDALKDPAKFEAAVKAIDAAVAAEARYPTEG